MTMVTTKLGDFYESAHRIRSEIAPGVTQTNVQKALEEIATQPTAVFPTAVTFAMSPYAPVALDSVLYVDTAGGAVTINLPAAALRNSIPLVIKDVTGHAAANPITLTPNGAETVETNANYVINADFGGVRLNPVAASGYVVAP